MATSKQKTTAPAASPVHHYFRTLVSSLFGFLAVALIMLSVIVVWLGNTLTNTNQFTRTVGPLVTNADVQTFVVDKASDALLDNKDVDIKDIAGQVLGQDKLAGKTDEQLRAETKESVKTSVQQVVSSQTFAVLWQTNIRQIHAQLVHQLNMNPSTVTLDFHPLIVGVIDQLTATKLSFIKDKMELKPDDGKVMLEGKQLANVHKVYVATKQTMIGIVALALALAALSVLISVHHLKTIRRIALATGIYAAILAALLSAASLVKLGDMDPEQQKFAVAILNGLTHDLRLGLVVIAVAGIGGALGSKLYSVAAAKRR
jgi:hypothetical protein